MARLEGKLKRQGIDSDKPLFSNFHDDYESETDKWFDEDEDEVGIDDEVDARKETLLAKVEAMLAQRIEQSKLITFHWKIV